MKPLVHKGKLGSINTEEWIQFQLKKCSEEQKAQKPFKPKECRIYITPEDEIQLHLDDLRKKREAKESSHKKSISDIYVEKDKEMEERRQNYINAEDNQFPDPSIFGKKRNEETFEVLRRSKKHKW